MNHPPQPNTCPQCSAVLPADAPQGLCPACLLAAVALPTEAGTAAPAKAPAPTREQVATAFPQLEILELIGAGGMGYVFKARQPKLDRLVALKLLPQHLGADAAFAGRFEREGRVLARLSHPNIVTVHDFGFARAGDWQSPFPSPRPPTDGDYKSPALPLSPDAQPETPNSQPGTAKPGFYYLLMEFVDGVNLRQAMRAGRFTPVQALEVVPKICEALQFAHEQGILHRDIKPENILIDKKGRVKITDFGLAKMVELGRNEHTVTGLVMGTPHYMAPEQVDTPKTVDHRADIYSMGVVFYELLTGELPIGRWQLPSHRNGVDARLDQVVLRALEREPDKRYQHASEMKLEVSRVQEFIPVARLVSAQATGIAVSGAFSSPLAPPGIVSAPSPANPGVVNISSPAAANAGWNAPAGFAPIRPNTPVNPSRMSGWVGTGFGLTIAAVVLAFAGLIVATSKYNSGHAPMAALICTFGLGAVLGSFGFLCNTIGLFDILFNTGRRHGFGLAVMTYAMDLLWLALGGMAFFIGEKPMAEGVVEKRISGPSAVTLPARAAILDSDAHVPPGWALALESRNYETPQELALLWKTSGIPPQAEARRARRLAYVTPNDGPMLFVTAIELRPGADAGEALRAESNHFDSESVGNMLVLYEASPRNRTLDREGYLEVRSWVEENLQRSASR